MTDTAEFDQFWAQVRADEEAARGRHADPSACGTCTSRVGDGQPVEHDECAARALLLKAPDQPSWEVLIEMTEEEKTALPARFHTPVWEGDAEPNAWLCAVCWGEGWVSSWPCATAVKHGTQVFTPDHEAEQQQKKDAAALEQARSIAVRLEQEVAHLTTELADLTERASRVSYSHQRFIEEHSDPGSEALGAQYELINKLSALPGGAELPLSPAETALRVVLATLDETQDDASFREIRGAIADALPHDGIDNRRSIYLDGKGNAWLSVATDTDGTEYIAPIDSPHNGDQPTGTVRETTGSLREIGRTW